MAHAPRTDASLQDSKVMRSKIKIFSLPQDRYRSRGKRGCRLWMMTSRPQYVPLLIFSLCRPVTNNF